MKFLKKIIFALFRFKSFFNEYWTNNKIWYFNWFQNPSNINIWDHNFIYYGNMFLAWNYKITIWNACHIAMNNLFITYSHDFNAQDIESIPYDKRYIGWDITIWDATWIWTRCTILPWVSIWKWCVIAAWAVVAKDVPDYEVWWWNPAKRISIRKNITQFDQLHKDKKYRRKLDK